MLIELQGCYYYFECISHESACPLSVYIIIYCIVFVTANKRPVILRPSQLEPQANSPVSSTTSNSNSSFMLSPAKLNNPCSKEGMFAIST